MLYITYLLAAFERVIVQVQLVFVGLDHVVAVAADRVVHVILGIVKIVLRSDCHTLREAMTHVDLLYLAENVTAGHFHARDNLLTFGDIQFQVLHRLIPPVGDEHEVLEAGMFEFLHDELDGPAIGHVAWQFLVVDRHVRCERVHNHLKGLSQWHMLLVLAPADVNKVEAVGGHGGGVNGT